jgi:type II secretory pathway pseudopilin PulG
MKTLLRLLLKSQHQRNRSGPAQTDKGMTLVELLVGSIMAFLILTPMLAFVVDMLNTDRREQVKTSTEQDIQAAVDFIAQDLSQAIYIYDNKAIQGPPGVNEELVISQLPTNANGTPILVFWKRKQIRNAVDPQQPPRTPDDCAQATANQPNSPNVCNDTYVRSLVAYYLVQERNPNSTWCQPSAIDCPSRIERYEISEGVKDPRLPLPNQNGYFNEGEVSESQEHSPAFNSNFDFNQPTKNVTVPQGFTDPNFTGSNPQVLVNYIDPSALVPTPPGNECQLALGEPRAQVGGTTTTSRIPEETLKVTDQATNSFYACVDTARNVARVTIRGNSLRRLQTNGTAYDPNKSAFFPTASVQVQGLGGLGK